MPVEITIISVPRSVRGGGTPPPPPDDPTDPHDGGVQNTTLNPIQVVGFVPVKDCAAVECRDIYEPCCEVLTVFADQEDDTTTMASTYTNDVNTFLFDYGVYGPQPSATITFQLQRCDNDVWTFVASLNNNTLGRYYALNTIAGHPTYAGVAIDWGLVFNTYGPGCYRLKVLSEVPGAGAMLESCLVSEVFRVLRWNCDRAHGFTKFESWITGRIGDINKQGRVFDVCGIEWYDSIRMRGFFGFAETAEYLEVMHEYPNGRQKRIRDEAIQEYVWKSGFFPKWLHDRFKIYGLMADTLWVSDYNNNNSDYEVRQKPIVKVGAYKPAYLDEQLRRLSYVEMRFREGTQGVIKSLCCDVVEGAGHG